MKYSEATQGRVFIIRLEDGEVIHEQVEKFAIDNNVQSASVIALGGIDKGSILVVGPEESRAKMINPMELILDDTYECMGTGTIFQDKDGKPVLHMHISAGRMDKTLTGCIRKGVIVWHVLELIITELVGGAAKRLPDKETGFELLVP